MIGLDWIGGSKSIIIEEVEATKEEPEMIAYF